MDMYQHYHFMCNYFLFIFLCMVRFLLAAKCIQYKSFLMELPKNSTETSNDSKSRYLDFWTCTIVFWTCSLEVCVE